MPSHLSRIRALMARDVERHAADIALLKIDLVGMRAYPERRAALDALRGYFPAIDLAALAALPVGTFGHAYARFMRDEGIRPFVLTDETDADMRARNPFGIRYAITHDMLHTLLGFGTDLPGELGVLAFTVGQRGSPWQRLQAIAAWVWYPLASGLAVGALWRAWRAGLRQGRRAPFLLGMRLEDRFGDDVAALRRELSLDPVPVAGRAGGVPAANR